MRPNTERANEDSGIQEALGRFFHQEIDRRYDSRFLGLPSGLQDKSGHTALLGERLEWIKRFFKRVVYPLGTRRSLRDQAMDTVISILGHTGSLVSLLPHLPGLVLRHGSRLTEVRGAAFELISAYRSANHLEEQCVAEARRLCREYNIDPSFPENLPEELLRSSYARLPEKETERMIKQVRNIVRLASKPKLLAATRDVVTHVRKARTDEAERAALDYIISVIDEIEDLSHSFSEDDINTVIRLAEETERKYFEELRSES